MEFKQKLLLIDGHALLHRAFHALPDFRNKAGFPTGAIFGFFSILFKAIAEIKPTHILATFDLKGPTFRHGLAADYKAHRKPMEDDLAIQLPKVQEILQVLEIPIYQKEGFEADDLLGIICHLTPKDMLNVIVTGDLDMLQLVNDKTVVYRLKTGISEVVVFDEKKVKEIYGLTPSQWLDYKALKGDASDNISGVPGIGEKTAKDLISGFKSIKKLYKAVEKEDERIKPAILKKLVVGKHYAFLSYDLAKIDPRYKIEFDLPQTRISDYDEQKVVKLFQELEIRSLIPRLPKLAKKAEKVREEKAQESHYELIDTQEKLNKLIKVLEKQTGFAINVETTLALPLEAELVGASFAIKENQAFYIPIYQKPELKALEKLKEVLEDPGIEKYGHDLKTDALVLKKYGTNLNPLSFDTMIAAYLVNPGLRSYDLESLGFSQFGMRKQIIPGFEGKSRDKIHFEKIGTDVACISSCEDTDVSLRLKPILEKELQEKKLTKIFDQIEMRLIPVLMGMEEQGILIDTDFLYKLSIKAEATIKKLEEKTHDLAGEEFNISSPIQLREVLFEKLRIPTDILKKRGKTGGLSTAATELEKLRGLHPIIDLIFEYRELIKLKSTYLDALPQLVSKIDKRIHTSYNQTIAATGRLSSSDPNLQNIPIRTELGNQVRKAFIAEEGFVLASLDYSQIELRIAASLSQDAEMIKTFSVKGDFHTATAAKLFDVKETEVTPRQRRDAKTINFSVLYGVSAFGLSERSEMTRAEASDYIKRYFKVFKKLQEYIDESIEQVHKEGFARNPLGRIRFFPEINSSNFSIRAAAERAAVNMPVQSLAADIMKMAMLKIYDFLRNPELVSGSADCRMLLSVHDELVFEIKSGEEKNYIPKVKEVMESVYGLKVPLVVDAKVGQNWMEMEKYSK